MDEAVTRRTTPAAFNGPLEAGLRAVVLLGTAPIRGPSICSGLSRSITFSCIRVISEDPRACIRRRHCILQNCWSVAEAR